jgi:hypothetical protein
MAFEEGKVCSGRIFAGGIWNVFACGATTSNATRKWRLRLDSASSKSVEILFQSLLTVGADGV